MYTIAVKRNFVAQHFLIGGNWGPENELHSHHYQVEVQLEGTTLNQHGYLVDIVEIEANLDALVAHYRDKCLNELAEFNGLNPSIEHFARLFCKAMAARIQTATLKAMTVKIWENDIAWASYRETF
jgi:6-pyruvoyltetrahydropterin/6-carboxytetrahydropterin synthase